MFRTYYNNVFLNCVLIILQIFYTTLKTKYIYLIRGKDVTIFKSIKIKKKVTIKYLSSTQFISLQKIY